jgi:hypothetical protein
MAFIPNGTSFVRTIHEPQGRRGIILKNNNKHVETMWSGHLESCNHVKQSFK